MKGSSFTKMCMQIEFDNFLYLLKCQIVEYDHFYLISIYSVHIFDTLVNARSEKIILDVS